MLALNASALLCWLRAGTQPNIALGFINKWAVEQAELIYASKY